MRTFSRARGFTLLAKRLIFGIENCAINGGVSHPAQFLMTKGYDINGDLIIINRELTELDIFLKDFLNVLIKHADCLVVSGFVSISTGRARGTEDIDVLVPKFEKKRFSDLFSDLKKAGFWCYQGDTLEEVFSYVKNMDHIRFARKDEMFPNIKFIPVDHTKKTQFFEFNHPQRITVKDSELKIPPIEFEISYKELMLKGKKDIEDARHLRTFFSDILKVERFKEYEMIKGGIDMRPKTDLDYVELYAEKLKKDNRLFKQQKKLIESQLKSSSSLFRNMFGKADFKEKARKYIKDISS